MSVAINSIGIAMRRYQLIKAYLKSRELNASFESVDVGYDLICPQGQE
jgi:LysR family D-serine deaminase transcriptional activator